MTGLASQAIRLQCGAVAQRRLREAAMNDSMEIDTWVAPIVDALGSRGLRAVVRAGWVTIDRATGPTRIDLAWGEKEQARVLAALLEKDPRRLANGCTLFAVGSSLVLQRPPDPLRRIDDLVAEGWISPLAARLLSQSLALGRNLLVVGPWAAGNELLAALLVEGVRPAVVGPAHSAVPPGWPRFDSPEQAKVYGADRVGCVSVATCDLVAGLGTLCGAIGWIDARRLDRALVRFEASAEGHANPMAVLAAIDLVVVIAAEPLPRVREISEIVLGEEGYRPLTLFGAGQPPAPNALVPLSAPTFVAELAQAGQTVLAEELWAASAYGTSTTEPTDLANAPVELAEPKVELPATPASFVRAPPKPNPVLDDAPPPGWELDQLEDQTEPGMGDADAAVMAATFGLAPPPRPAGLKNRAAPFEGTFAEALSRAKQRDAELREELRQAQDDEDNDFT